ncbi:hypothetical protein K1T71_009117 [Dendrolimus kikuchii]|uniref:Uncharacterized protein n=1 Tax=Dendrolimus kikuchii TaxID=765133 RepID=A0ACC1CTJ0_9NEOP|nr:hypothetical protein K1T71_009117 [Dendrolimus kikuchii]
MLRENCVVNLNSDSTGSFYTGDIVTGTVVLEFEKEENIESLDFEVYGVSKAQWSRAKPTIPYIKIYSEKTKILSIKINNVFNDIIAGKRIKPGIYSYPFHFALPVDLPSSFHSSIAKVHYSIRIKSKPFYKIRKTVPFTVLGNVNLNHIEDYLVSSTYEFEKTFRNSGLLHITVRTYTGFASKQTVPIEIAIHNEKKIKIQKINISLIQKLKYTVSKGYAEEERKMSKTEHRKFSNTLAEICNFDFDLPQLIPSSVHIIDPMVDISYLFRIEVTFPFHFALCGDIPVTVSTVPVIHYDF